MKKILFVFSVVLFFSLTACNQADDVSNTGGNGQPLKEQTLPISDEPITLSYWAQFDILYGETMKTMDDNIAYQELERRTNIKLKFIHPPRGQETEQFNLLIASGDLPDIIERFGSRYQGGADKAIEDGVYLRLNEYIDKYAPNYKRWRETYPEIARETITDNGNIWEFASIDADVSSSDPPWRGLIIRQDWLDELNLPVPETIDEWETTLTQFKEQKKVTAPMMLIKHGVDRWSKTFLGAFDIDIGFFRIGDKVKYGPMEQGYKEYLTVMNRWYEAGLIDKDFATRDDRSFDAYATSGRAGAWPGTNTTHLVSYEKTAQAAEPGYKLSPAPYPSLVKGEKPKVRLKVDVNFDWGAVITSTCKTPVEAVRWLDYHYSPEGMELFNWGVEGVSHTVVDGKRVFTDAVMKDPGGKSPSLMAFKYKIHNAPYPKLYDAYPPVEPLAQLAYDVWAAAGTDYCLPKLSLTTEENQESAAIMSDINTYEYEMTVKFIMGIEPISVFDEFVARLEKMKVSRALEIQQAALDRYLRR